MPVATREDPGRAAGARAAAGPAIREDRVLRALLGAAIATTALLLAWHLGRVLELGAARPLGLVLALACGVAGADLLTGIVHWACDTWGREDTPWVGPALIRGFRAHHRMPEEMAAHDAIEVNGQAAVAAGAVLLLLALPGAQAWLAGRPLAYAALWSLIAFAAAANHLHLWAHHPRPPALARALQRSGLILSARRHMRHHRAPFDAAYCISTGWTSRALDAIGFWRALERAIRALTGATPRADADEIRSTTEEPSRS